MTTATINHVPADATDSVADLLPGISDGDPSGLGRNPPPVWQMTWLRTLFTDSPRPYAEVARGAGIPPGRIGPTRARALRQPRGKLDEHEVGSDAPI